MKLGTAAAAAAIWCCAGAAQADTTRMAVTACITATQATGAYIVSVAGGQPRVAAASGGTARGVRDVNDCLADTYAVQYQRNQLTREVAAAPASVSAVSVVGVAEREATCKRIRNRRIGSSIAAATGFALGIGDTYQTSAAIGGLLGIGITTRSQSLRFRDCMAQARSTAATGDGRTTSVFCSGGSPLVGGNGYCARQQSK